MGQMLVIILVVVALLWFVITIVIPAIFSVVPKILMLGVGLILIFVFLDSIGINPISVSAAFGFNPAWAILIILGIIVMLIFF